MNVFMVNPDFSIEGVLKSEKPVEMLEMWKCYGCDDIILHLSNNPATRYLTAKSRYKMLSKFVRTNPCAPLFLVLADTHFWLEDFRGSLEYLIKLQNLLVSDPVSLQRLDTIVELVQNSIVEQTVSDDLYHYGDLDFLSENFDCKITHVDFYCRPSVCTPSVCNVTDISDIGSIWNKIVTNADEGEAMRQFERLACIATNDLEGVFQVEGQTWPRLIRCGFFQNSIEGISKNSKIKKSKVIIRILENTSKCLLEIGSVLNRGHNNFNVSFIKHLHYLLMKDDDISEDIVENEHYEEYSMFSLVCIGKFRQKACMTNHNDRVVQYCHYTMIEEEMTYFVAQAQVILSNANMDPFQKCAWLQWAFMRIHPFEDGNGRIGRIISSIPLAELSLPPVVITSQYKRQYFEALATADAEGELMPLAVFLKESLLRGMDTIHMLPTDRELPAVHHSPKSPINNRSRRRTSTGSTSSEDNEKKSCLDRVV